MTLNLKTQLRNGLIYLFFSGGNTSVSFELKFTSISWQTMLALQLALENSTFLGSRGVFDEAGCRSLNDIICKLELDLNWPFHSLLHSRFLVSSRNAPA